MLGELSNLPKTIDAFVGGVIEFFYRLLRGFVLVWRKPVLGSIRLYAREEDLSSGTTLFCASAFLGTLYFVSLPNIAQISTNPGLISVFWGICALYVAFDLLSIGTGALSARRGRRRVRATALMRYSFAATLMLGVVVALVLQAFQVAEIRLLSYLAAYLKYDRPLVLFILELGAISLFYFYPPTVTFFSLVGLRRRGRRSAIAISVATMVALPLCFLLLTGVQRAVLTVDDALDGSVRAVSLVCEASDDMVQIAAGLVNESDDTIFISKNGFKLKIALARSELEPMPKRWLAKMTLCISTRSKAAFSCSSPTRRSSSKGTPISELPTSSGCSQARMEALANLPHIA